MNALMATSANDQGFSLSLCHSLYPQRFLFSSSPVQVSQLPNVMNLYVRARATEFTGVREKSFDEFVAVMASQLREGRIEVGDDYLFLSPERYAPKTSNERLLSIFSLDDNLSADQCSIRCLRCRSVSLGHDFQACPMLPRQCSQQGSLHNPMELVKP